MMVNWGRMFIHDLIGWLIYDGSKDKAIKIDLQGFNFNAKRSVYE